MHGHQLHGIVRLGGDVSRSERSHGIVIARLCLPTEASRFLKERDVFQKFPQRSLARHLLRFAAQSAANSWSRCRGNESPIRNELRMIRIAAGIMPSALARSCRASPHGFHHVEPSGELVQHRFDRGVSLRPAPARRGSARDQRRTAATLQHETGQPHRGIKDAQHCQGIAHLRRVEEIGAPDLDRNTAAAKLVHYFLAMVVIAIQHSEMVVLHRRPSPARGFDGIGDEASILILVVHDGVHNSRLCGQVLLALQPGADEPADAASLRPPTPCCRPRGCTG